MERRQFRKTFSRSTFSSLIATAVDFSSLVFLVEAVGVHYVVATACAALAGAITNFSINKYWAFPPTYKRTTFQGLQYFAVSTGSLLLNTYLVFFFTDFIKMRYLNSKIIAAVFVSWGWNYPLHKRFVFKD